MPAPKNYAAENSRAHRRPQSNTVAERRALVLLPAAGVDLPVPDLPPGREWTPHERARWDELWSSPQSSQWDESAAGTVAALVVFEGAILSGGASAWQAQEARYAADALGLTPKSMAALGWRIVEGQ